jgi:uncharacterized protein (DUF2249 family)
MSIIPKDKSLVCLDVRPILSGGNDPFNTIMETVKNLKEGQTLQIINTFQPLPLITKLERSGYKSWTEKQESGIFHTFFKKNKVVEEIDESNYAQENLNFDELYKTFVGKLKSIDVRNLEMPEPMTTILEELEKLPEGFALFVDHKKVPQFLLPELEERNFEIHYKEMALEHLQLLIFKK